MGAQGAVRVDEVGDDELLDADTSAAILRWMETALVPAGIDPAEWERWLENGCPGSLSIAGAPVTPAMLGHWGRTGALLQS